MVISNCIVVLMVISLIRNNVRNSLWGKNPAGENPHGEYLCSFSVKLTAEKTANLFSEFIFGFKKMFKQNKLFFLLFSIHRGIFPHGPNTLWGSTPMGYVKLLKSHEKHLKAHNKKKHSLSLINGKERF